MAKKEKIQLTPEEIAAKKLRTKKGWARFGAVALAIVITGAVYVIGSKDGPKVVTEVEEPPVIQQIIQQNPTPAPAPAPAPTTKAPAPTTAAPTTKAPAPTTAPTTAANNGGGGGGILDTITGLLGGLGDFDIGSLLGGLGGDGGGLGGLVDRNSIADTVEGAGGKAKDFFYGLADNVEENEGLGDINDQLRDRIGGIGGDSGSGDSGNPLSGITDGIDLGGLTGGDGGSPLSGITDALGGLTGGDGGSPLSGITDALGGLLGGLGG
jgi:hypothetical protein